VVKIWDEMAAKDGGWEIERVWNIWAELAR
jgi:hypothetical protein